MIRALKWTLILFGVVVGLGTALHLAFNLYLSNQTYVAFQSSDGNWSSQEDIKSGVFERIVFSFELYKVHCKAKDAVLQRTTVNPDSSLESRRELKWKVPFAARIPKLEGIPYYKSACESGGYSESEIKMASKNTDSYLLKLKSGSN